MVHVFLICFAACIFFVLTDSKSLALLTQAQRGLWVWWWGKRAWICFTSTIPTVTAPATVTKVVSERPFGPVRLVIGDIRGASRPFRGVVVGEESLDRYYKHDTHGLGPGHGHGHGTRPRHTATVTATDTDTVTVSATVSSPATASVSVTDQCVNRQHIAPTRSSRSRQFFACVVSTRRNFSRILIISMDSRVEP